MPSTMIRTRNVRDRCRRCRCKRRDLSTSPNRPGPKPAPGVEPSSCVIDTAIERTRFGLPPGKRGRWRLRTRRSTYQTTWIMLRFAFADGAQRIWRNAYLEYGETGTTPLNPQAPRGRETPLQLHKQEHPFALPGGEASIIVSPTISEPELQDGAVPSLAIPRYGRWFRAAPRQTSCFPASVSCQPSEPPTLASHFNE